MLILPMQIIRILGNQNESCKSRLVLRKKKNVAVLQNKRWNEILGKMILDGEEKELSEEFILKNL
jgi:chorismate mutase